VISAFESLKSRSIRILFEFKLRLNEIQNFLSNSIRRSILSTINFLFLTTLMSNIGLLNLCRCLLTDLLISSFAFSK